MQFIFADDSRQLHPSRRDMRPFVAIGGVHVAANVVRPLSAALDRLCVERGFPLGEEFKWSPRRNTWMHSNLHDDDRRVERIEGVRVICDPLLLRDKRNRALEAG